VIGLDTNVVVRYLTEDDPAQARVAARMIDSLSKENRGFLSLVVIVELVWVLEDSYNFKKNEIVKVIENLLGSEELIVERAEVVVKALGTFRVNRAGFADCLIERCGDAAECKYTATFDRHAAAAGMRLLS
jgi:predicted nucleic-acid-binding protein